MTRFDTARRPSRPVIKRPARAPQCLSWDVTGWAKARIYQPSARDAAVWPHAEAGKTASNQHSQPTKNWPEFADIMWRKTDSTTPVHSLGKAIQKCLS
jgi:hypothetical protein